MKPNLILLILFLFLVSACTRSGPDTSKITVSMPSSQKAAANLQKAVISQNLAGTLAAQTAVSKWGLSLPAGADEFNCFAIAVSAPDLQDNIVCRTLDGVSDDVHNIVGVFPEGSIQSIEVASGQQRKIELIGFKTDDPYHCKDLGEKGGILPAAHFSPPVILASTVTDLNPGAVNISLKMKTGVDYGVAFEDCDEKPFASATMIEALASGMPAATSNATVLNATVRGFNVSQYRYAVTNDTTCFQGPYSEWTSIDQPITAHNFAGLNDGSVALCVQGRSSTGGEQFYPTAYVWNKDSTAPGAPTISLAYYSDSTPDITVNGTSPGDTIEIFSGSSPGQYCQNTPITTALAAAGGNSTLVTVSPAIAEGPHFITARLKDSLGNAGPCVAAGANLVVDSILPPPPVVSAPEVGTTLEFSPFYAWDPVLESFPATAITRYEIAIGTTADITSISKWSSVDLKYNYVASSLLLLDGFTYTFSVRAVDAAGNEGAHATRSWVVNNVNAPWKQQAYFKADKPDPGDFFGTSVDIDGDRMVVGAHYEASNQRGISATGSDDNSSYHSGAAYVYKRGVNGQWQLEAYLKADDAEANDGFGYAVAISGNTILVSAPTEKSLYNSISTSGDNSTAASNVGAVYTFVNNGAGWVRESYIKAPDSAASWVFGFSADIDQDTLVVGARGSGGSNRGAAYVYSRSTGEWKYQQRLTLETLQPNDLFGNRVAVHGSRIAVSSENYQSQGVVAVYEYSQANSIWELTAELQAHNKTDFDYFGASLSIHGDRIAVGAPNEDGNTYAVDSTAPFETSRLSDDNRGAVYIFEKKDTAWTQTAYIKPSNSSYGQQFGSSVALHGSNLAVGAEGEKSNAGSSYYPAPVSTNTQLSWAGAVYVFQIQPNGDYRQSAYLKAPNNSSGIYFGDKLAISNTAIAIGAYPESSQGKDVLNGATAPANSGSSNSGAVYLFEPDIP